jgi:carboxyl-terminal processing protease
MSRLRPFLLSLFVLVVVASGAFAAGVAAERSGIAPGAVRVQPPELEDEFSVFWQTWQLVHENFVGRSTLDDDTLAGGAVDGLVASLGDTGHTRFLNPEEAAFQASEIAGEFEGIGAQMGMRDGYPVIVAPLDGSPAERAGLLAGDVIVEVNGQPVAGMSLDRIVAMVRGPKGTTVTLSVIHSGENSISEITVERDKIQVHPVSWIQIPGTQLGHLRISQFTATANQELVKAVREMRAAGIQGLVVDVRSNPGGLLDQAVSVTSQFLSSGYVLVEEDAQGNRKPTPVVPGGQATDLPMVTLIDLGTASAAEIFAGAMQDQKRGQVVGETSFGTGTVLTPFSLSDGSVLLLGTSQWLTPGGRQIWKQGIAPDVRVTTPAGAGHLTPARMRGMTPEQFRASGDAQLLKAVELLTQ